MKELIAAVIKFQSELKPVIKDSSNPFFKSKYADLSSILEEVMPLLSRNELAMVQTCRVDGTTTILQTRIMHSSGQELVSECIIPMNLDVQKMGSQITYYKRYMLQAALGVATANEDDDGAKATGNVEQIPQEKTKGDFVVNVGKFKGLKLKDIKKEELVNYCTYITSSGNELNGPMKEFIDASRIYLRA